MPYTRLRVLALSLICCLVLFLAACSPGSPTGNGGTPTPGGTQAAGSPTGTTPTATPNPTQKVPPTQTSCPAGGSGRAAVTAHLALGNHPNIVYVYNVGSADHPGASFLKRFDATTGAKTVIATFSNSYVADAQVSSDGQWVLFVVYSGGQARLQMVRLDGQGLQTLYCSSPANGAFVGSALLSPQWSTDQRHVIFAQLTGSNNQIILLTLTSGSVQTEFAAQGQFYTPITWLDNTRVYISHQFPDGPADSLYLLDTSKGANQPASNLRIIYKQNVDASHFPCWNADSSYDATVAFVSECTAAASTQHPGEGAVEGPSRIIWMSSVGNQPRTIYTNSAGAITSIRAVTSSNLLFTIDSQAIDKVATVNTSQNGLWKIGVNGSGATRLTSTVGNLNGASQFPWSNVSRDSSFYSLQIASGSTQSLAYGSLSGGALTTFASTTAGSTSDLSVAGWTTM